MTEELDSKLCQDFPNLFKNRYASLTETCMCWGFECEDGWFDLIYNLCVNIQNYIIESKFENIEVLQVKEKYGNLRFYISSGDEYIFNLINQAENESKTICEICGKKGKIIEKNGWYKCRCEECKNK